MSQAETILTPPAPPTPRAPHQGSLTLTPGLTQGKSPEQQNREAPPPPPPGEDAVVFCGEEPGVTQAKAVQAAAEGPTTPLSPHGGSAAVEIRLFEARLMSCAALLTRVLDLSSSEHDGGEVGIIRALRDHVSALQARLADTSLTAGAAAAVEAAEAVREVVSAEASEVLEELEDVKDAAELWQEGQGGGGEISRLLQEAIELLGVRTTGTTAVHRTAASPTGSPKGATRHAEVLV
jgi:hypothetical protein